MAFLTTWLKQAGGVILAALLICVSIAPAIDSLVCSSDATAIASVHADAMASVASETSEQGHADDAGAPCLHGHCHHGAAALPALQQADAAVSFHGERLSADRRRVTTAGRQFEMIRPPRA